MLSNLLKRPYQLKTANLRHSLRLSTPHTLFQSTMRPSSSSVKIPYNSNLQGMIQWYQENGHQMAQTDPLGLVK